MMIEIRPPSPPLPHKGAGAETTRFDHPETVLQFPFELRRPGPGR